MTAPRIPYFELPDLTLVEPGAFGAGVPPMPIAFKPFGTLVAIGVYVGAFLAIRHGRRLGVHERSLTSFMLWVGVSGFLFGHVLDTLFYFPERVLSDPLSLVRVWEGLSSFGGFAGALIGALAWKAHHRTPILGYSDVVASAFPVGWMFGRMGCSLAHDHPGRLSEAWIAVQYPDGGRFDLGLYELWLTVPIAVAFLVLRRRPRAPGFYLGLFGVSYAPSRFALDFLRSTDLVISDARHLGLTPAQWASVPLFIVGVVLLTRALGQPEAPLPPPPAPALEIEKRRSGPDVKRRGRNRRHRG